LPTITAKTKKAMTPKEIQSSVADVMVEFEKRFKQTMKSKTALLDKITHYIIKRKGKQMRPMFVFLSAGIFGEINNRSYTAATLIELLHTATLVHDDVVDESYERRGFFSLNALWKNKIAVLVGDFLLSKGLLLSIDNDDFDILKHISVAVREMSEGELLQIEKARKLDITEEIYFEIIRQKTATLIAACCGIGAASVGANQETVQQMRKFGEYIGIAFQIKDDLFDYSDEKIGKPTGIDIKEQKMTLPLIHTLNTCSEKDKNWIINSVKKYNKDKKRVKEVITFVKENGGIEYTTSKMNDYKNRALAILENYPDSPYKDSLRQMIDYVVERKI
jgi:octaprenyl-diphosphate synthase